MELDLGNISASIASIFCHNSWLRDRHYQLKISFQVFLEARPGRLLRGQRDYALRTDNRRQRLLPGQQHPPEFVDKLFLQPHYLLSSSHLISSQKQFSANLKQKLAKHFPANIKQKLDFPWFNSRDRQKC